MTGGGSGNDRPTAGKVLAAHMAGAFGSHTDRQLVRFMHGRPGVA